MVSHSQKWAPVYVPRPRPCPRPRPRLAAPPPRMTCAAVERSDLCAGTGLVAIVRVSLERTSFFFGTLWFDGAVVEGGADNVGIVFDEGLRGEGVVVELGPGLLVEVAAESWF